MPSGFDQENPKTLDNVQDQALAWFARLQDSKTGAADRAEFADWLAASPAHQTAYDQVLQLWESPALNAALSYHAAIPLRPGRRKLTTMRWATAASVLLLSGWFLVTGGWLNRWQADIATATGEQRRVTLADGSALILNTDSAVKLDFAEERRGVRLLNGEAYFEVTADKTRPFVVTTEHGSVRVVGTRFSVRTGVSTEVNVESGIVLCSAKQGGSRQLTVGQHTVIDDSNVAPIEALANDQAFAWLKGRLVFQNQTLAEVVAELDRYHPGTIVIADAGLGQVRITGNYKLDNTAELLKTLGQIAGAKVVTFSNYLTLLRR